MAHALRLGKRTDVDMTTGSIAANLLRFALPLMVGNLFQQLYNMVDTWVIGQTGDTAAYAAVGSVGPITNILIGFFTGLASGAGVVISQYYGAKKYDQVSKAAHTAMVMTLLLGVLFTLIGVLGTPLILNLMLPGEETKAVFEFGRTYLTIYFAGVLGLMVYNMGAGILRAIGDSNRPFYFLIVSSLTNIALDLFFVFGPWKMGVESVALATVIAQWVSALLTIVVLLRSTTCVQIFWNRLRMDMAILRQIIRIGIPAAIQMAITAFSNVFVQSYVAGVNTDATYCLAGWTSYSKIDHFIFLPVQSISLAVMTFVGQNLGAGDVPRARRGTWIGYLIGTASAVCIIVPVMLFAPQLAPVFNSDPKVVHYAVMLLRTITPFYMLCSVNQVLAASLRGAGNTRAPMIIMISTFVGFRQLYLFLVSNFVSNEILPLAMGYPAGWFACCVCFVLYYRHYRFGKNSVVQSTKEGVR
ncbi:MAG: MATE family efflux transporter [Clostridia bacterium]|nr:MATE family efflux transporter [Clostridia bacterium]